MMLCVYKVHLPLKRYRHQCVLTLSLYMLSFINVISIYRYCFRTLLKVCYMKVSTNDILVTLIGYFWHTLDCLKLIIITHQQTAYTKLGGWMSEADPEQTMTSGLSCIAPLHSCDESPQVPHQCSPRVAMAQLVRSPAGWAHWRPGFDFTLWVRSRATNDP